MARAKRIYILIIKVNRLFSFFSSQCFLKEIENMYSVFLSSYRNTRESLGEPEKAVEIVACASCSHSISRSPKLPLVAKRSKHVNATDISQHCWAQHVACVWPPCCAMLGVVGSGLKMVKFEPTTPNTSQHVATGWANARNMLRPTMLRYVALACCDRLAGALNN